MKLLLLALAFAVPRFAIAQESALPLVQKSFDLEVDSLDGQPIVLDARVDLPATPGPWPLVVLLSGSGPADVDGSMEFPMPADRCRQYQGESVSNGHCRWRFNEMTGRQIAGLGLAVARISKRGIRQDAAREPLPPNMHQHGTGTASRRVADVEKLVAALRAMPEIDASAVYFYGISEGTVIANLYANAHPDQVKGMVLIGAVLDSLESIFHFQAVQVHFPRMLAKVDGDHDGKISATEWDLRKLSERDSRTPGAPEFADRLENYSRLGIKVDFAYFDFNHDGWITQPEFESRLEADCWRPMLEALRANDRAQFNATDPDGGTNSFEQVKEWFALGRLADRLVQLNVPVSIFIGENDLNTPPAQLDGFWSQVQKNGKEALFRAEIVRGDGHNGAKLVAAAIERIRASGWAR